MNQPPRSARPIIQQNVQPPVIPPAARVMQREITETSNGDQLERQLDAIMRTTTVEDLAKRGGQLKTVKERDLRELIRQSLLQLLQSSTAISEGEQERILDQVQGELKKAMHARASEQAEHLALTTENKGLHGRLAQLEREHGERAGEVGHLRAVLAEAEAQAHTLRAELDLERLSSKPLAGTERWAKAVDEAWFAGRHRRESARRGTDHAETLADSLHGHLASCDQLLTDYPATPPGSDAAGDVLARVKALIALRVRDQSWIAELQGRSATLLTERSVLQGERDSLVLERDVLIRERDAARAAVDAELQRTIELEAQIEDLDLLLANAPDAALHTTSASVESELAEVRDRLADTLSRLEDAARIKSRLEQELATAAGIRATAEHRTGLAQAQVAEFTLRVQELQSQLGDQRRTTDLARRASVEAETVRGEVEGLRKLLADREHVLAGERQKYHQERDKHRSDTTTRLDAIRRFEQALLALKDQLSERERQLAEAHAELEVLRAAPTPAVIAPLQAADRAGEIAALVNEIASTRSQVTLLSAARDQAERGQRLADAERRALLAHQADAVRVQQERDHALRELTTAEARATQVISERDAALARAALAVAEVEAVKVSTAEAARTANAQAARTAAEAARATAPVVDERELVAVRQERDRLLAALRDAERSAGAAALEPRLAQLASGIEHLMGRQPPAPALPPAPTDLGPIEGELAKIRALLAAMPLARVEDVRTNDSRPQELVPAPAPVLAPTPAPAVALISAPPVVPPAPAQVFAPPTRAKRKAPPARLAGPACLGEDGRARYAYLRGSSPRLVVHGTTWHHQTVAASSAAPGATPVIVVQEGVSWIVYRDRNGAVHRAGPSGHEPLLPEGSALGDPAILVDPGHERWLIAARDQQGEIRIHAVAAAGITSIGRISGSAGDPAWWSGERDTAHRLCVPTGGADVAFYTESNNSDWTLSGHSTLSPAVSSIESVAIAGRGRDALLAVRSAEGVVAAQRAKPDGTWESAVVLDASGAPAIGRLAAAHGDGEALVAYRASDGLLQIMLHRGQWRHLAFGSNFKAPAAASDPQLLLHEGLIRCFYQGTDGHVHEVRNSTAGWNTYDLSVLSRDL